MQDGKLDLTVNGVLSGFWHKEKEILSILYNFKDEDFKAFDKQGESGYLFRGIKIANLLISRLEENIKEFSSEIKTAC